MKVLEELKPADLSLPTLPELCPSFRMSRLSGKPQNPIIDSLQFWNLRSTKSLPQIKVDHSESLPIEDDFGHGKPLESDEKSIWANATTRNPPQVNTVMSWDALCHRASTPASAFLAERSDYTFAAARHIALPTFQDESIRIVNVLPRELFECITMTLLGVSSPLHVWDPEKESFSFRGLSDNETGKLVVPPLDDVASQSLVHRFLTIGTLTRRLEVLILQLQAITSGNRKHLHALGHSISSVLSSTQAVLSELIQSTPTNQSHIHVLNSLWSSCADTADQLQDLADLCGRGASVLPNQYPTLSPTPSELLSSIYAHLHSLFEKRAPHSVIATCAFVLTSTSIDYLQRICHVVGYSPLDDDAAMQPRQSGNLTSVLSGDDSQGNGESLIEDDTELGDAFPCFFTPKFSEAITRASRSLKLLQIARSDHPLLAPAKNRLQVRWFWSDKDVREAWLGSGGIEHPSYQPKGSVSPSNNVYGVSMIQSKPSNHDEAMQAFALFDLEPGTHITSIAGPSTQYVRSFANFLEGFPVYLPSLTPTLEMLRDLVLSPLATHVESLSVALQDTFLSKSSGYLDFRRHLILLRSYLLLTSHSFKTRLGSALFCDAPEPLSTEPSARTMAVRASRSFSRRRTPKLTTQSWVIGLAPTLTDGSSWPPGGSDLSFYLRTVIIDSLEADYHHGGMGHNDGEAGLKEKSQIWEEAEWRLGFAIRDLPVGSRARWLNPRSMEAMDFLYMDYHPPHPLDVLMPTSTLSKYHRIFAFNLRLMRVEYVMKALFRMSQDTTSPLFETLAPSRRLFLYFRFIANSFVDSFSSYVYDTAIGGNFDAFVYNLTSPADREKDNILPIFSDVFALADYHSKVMDDILGACLLRSSQKAVGDLLRGALEVILEFGIVMSDLRSGQLQEYEAAGPLEDLFSTFRRKMILLRSALKEMVDKSRSTPGAMPEDPDVHVLSSSLPTVAGNLHNLFIRISIPESWQGLQP